MAQAYGYGNGSEDNDQPGAGEEAYVALDVSRNEGQPPNWPPEGVSNANASSAKKAPAKAETGSEPEVAIEMPLRAAEPDAQPQEYKRSNSRRGIERAGCAIFCACCCCSIVPLFVGLVASNTIKNKRDEAAFGNDVRDPLLIVGSLVGALILLIVYLKYGRTQAAEQQPLNDLLDPVRRSSPVHSGVAPRPNYGAPESKPNPNIPRP